MKTRFKIAAIVLLFLFARGAWGQVNSLQISAEKEKMYSPYLYWRHGGKEGLEAFKREQPYQYLKELWYVCESWYIKKDYLPTGVALEPYVVCIERFESYRKETEEAYLVLPGCKDAIVFLPINKLIYRPNEK